MLKFPVFREKNFFNLLITLLMREKLKKVGAKKVRTSAKQVYIFRGVSQIHNAVIKIEIRQLPFLEYS
jgi:hypothetical protein